MIKAHVKNDGFALSRRSFLIGSAGTVLVMGFGGLLPSGSARSAVEKRQFSPTVWFEIDGDGKTRDR